MNCSESSEINTTFFSALAESPASLELRYLQTLVEMSSERNATIIPIPIDIFRQVARALNSE